MGREVGGRGLEAGTSCEPDDLALAVGEGENHDALVGERGQEIGVGRDVGLGKRRDGIWRGGDTASDDWELWRASR